MAVELDFDAAGTAGEVAGGAVGEGLSEVAFRGLGVQGGCSCWGAAGLGEGVFERRRRGGGVAVVEPVLGGGWRVGGGELAEDVRRGVWIFDGGVGRGAFGGGQLVELFDLGVVAEGVGPPAGDEVEAVALHVFEEFPTAVGGAGKFLFVVVGFGGGFGGFVLGARLCAGDGAEVAFVVEDHRLVGIGGVGGVGVLRVWGGRAGAIAMGEIRRGVLVWSGRLGGGLCSCGGARCCIC